MECCVIRDSKGTMFIVGNVCVGKTGDAGLFDTVKRAINRKKTAERHEKEIAKIQAIKASLASDEIRAKLSSEPHPLEWKAEQGYTMLEWAEWMMFHAGNSGKMRVAKKINELAAA